MDCKKLKRIVIKEELVAITGDFILAVILNQFLYWTERVRDFDKMLEEEKTIAEKEGIDLKTPLKCGWIYKKAEELIEETMLGISQTSMRNKIKLLIQMGFLTERNNPNYKWDHTKQYRVNFYNLKNELEKHGYSLQGYKVFKNGENIVSQNLRYEPQPDKNRISEFEIQDSEFEIQDSEFEEQYQKLQTDITTDITTKRKKARKANTKKDNAKSFNELIDSYTQNETLRAELKEHLKIRKSKKSALTNRAIELSLKKLDDIAETDEEKILIVQNAIMRGWTGFFPLKDSDRPTTKNKRSYDIDEFENYNIFADKESKEAKEADEYSKYYDYDMADFYKTRQ